MVRALSLATDKWHEGIKGKTMGICVSLFAEIHTIILTQNSATHYKQQEISIQFFFFNFKQFISKRRLLKIDYAISIILNFSNGCIQSCQNHLLTQFLFNFGIKN